jgi:hypothetical protein
MLLLSFRNKVKKVVPKVDLQSYNVLVAGGFKSGKTRLWKEVMELHYPNEPDAGTLLAFEPGYNTWELDSVIPMHDYDWKFFKNDVVKGLVEEAKKGRITKVIGIDTVDRLMDMAGEFILDQINKKYGKNFTGLQEISENIKGENGYMLLKKEVWKQIDILKNAGYGFFWLAWTKEKETTTIDGLKYNSIELMMSKTGADIFASQADLTCTLFSEVKVLDKDGNELETNVKTKGGKELASKFHTTEVNMYFLPSNYIGIAGGRFTELPEKVSYSAENFMAVFEEAVKGQLKKTTKTVDELKVEETEKREEKVKEFADKVENDPEAILAEIGEVIAKMSAPQKQLAASKFKEKFGVNNYKQEAGNLENLKIALDVVNEILAN